MFSNKMFPSHNFLGRVLLPSKDPSRLIMEPQCVVGAGVPAHKVVIIRLKNQVRPGVEEEVDGELACRHGRSETVHHACRVQWVHRLGPAAYVAYRSVGVNANVVDADIVDALIEGAVLSAGAGVALGDEGHGGLPSLVPVTGILDLDGQLWLFTC